MSRVTIKLDDELPVLSAGATTLLRALDARFEGWGTRLGATPMIMPPLLPVAALAALDVYDNFPHQALVTSPLDLDRHRPGTRPAEFPPEELEPARMALPSAACFAVYLHLAGQPVTDPTRVTVLGRCFRREEHYEELRRILGFHMREIVMLGSRESVQRHLQEFGERITDFAGALDLPIRKAAASDPFYDQAGQRALLQRLAPVKHEFLVDGLAIASLNQHRNFFGERCGIALAGTAQHAYSGCVAFGLERWLSALRDRYGDWDPALAAVERAGDGQGS